MKRVLDTEPVASLLAALVALIDAALVAGTALGWLSLTADQTAALVTLATALTAVIGTVLRASVWAPASVESLRAPAQPKEV